MSTYPPVPTKLVPSGGGSDTPGQTYYPPVPAGSSGGSDTSNPGQGQGHGFNRQGFIKNYANMVAQTWTDDSYLQLIISNPVDTLAQAGMPTIAGAVIRVIQHKITGMGKIEDQVNAWIDGNRTGLYDLYLPIKPDNVDISPGGGAMALKSSGGNSCCCSPCCCCT